MNGFYTIVLLILSNVFMTLAWYGHLKLQASGVSTKWPLIGVIAFSWGIAFFRVLLSSAGQSYRLSRKRRPVFSYSVESHSGMYQPRCVCSYCQHHVSGAEPSLESYPCIPVNYMCSLPCLYEMTGFCLNTFS